MVAYKASQLLSIIDAPDAAIGAFLLYGPDPAQVAEHAASLSVRLSEASDPPGEVVRISDRDLAEQPGLISIEAGTVSMFAASKVIRVGASARLPVDEIETILAEGSDARLVVEAGALRPTAKLRKIFEASKRAAALPCYELDARNMGGIIDRTLGAQDITIDTEARQLLVERFDGNAAKARSELEKLALFAGQGARVTVDDVEACVGDVAQAALDGLCIAVGNRRTAEALRQLDSLNASGQNAQGAILALGRHFERLHRVCAGVEAGKNSGSVFSSFRPPLHFRVKDALQRQSRDWSGKGSKRALELIWKAMGSARRRPDLDSQFAERLVVLLSR